MDSVVRIKRILRIFIGKIDLAHMVSDSRILDILMEELDSVEGLKAINSSHGLTPWDPATKMERMRPGNAAKARFNPSNGTFKLHSYRDWKERFSGSGMSYSDYLKTEL